MTADLFEVMEATWPAASRTKQGPWVHRDGAGGGKRVSATTLEGPLSDLPDRELFSVREDQTDFDEALAAQGYTVLDPSIILAAPIALLTQHEVPATTAFTIWQPLQIMNDMWTAGGVGQARRDVMNRAQCQKTSVLGRISDRAAGTGYVGLHDEVAMLHSLDVHSDHRRKGLARHMMVQAAKWASDHGARLFASIVVADNEPSLALHRSLGMAEVGRYHYRVKPSA